MFCGSDPQIVPHLTLGEGKPESLGSNKWYRSHMGQDSSFPPLLRGNAYRSLE